MYLQNVTISTFLGLEIFAFLYQSICTTFLENMIIALICIYIYLSGHVHFLCYFYKAALFGPKFRYIMAIVVLNR